MRTWTLAFLCGVLLLQQFSFLPSNYWVVPLIIAAIFLIKRSRYLFAALCGFIWTLWYVNTLLTWSLPTESEGKKIIITGYIASIPAVTEHRASFLFTLKNHRHVFIKLSTQNKFHHLQVGDEWQFLVKLKRIHGLMNPGGFDYESWALQENVRANGYVVNGEENKLIASHWYHSPWNRIRQKLKENIEMHLPVSSTSPWILALALGERQNISADKWEVLRNTGTNHLMAIAGLHIGFMASFTGLLVNRLWRRTRRGMLVIPAQYAGALAALMMAFIYSALAGFSIPTQRACLMLSVALIIHLLRRTTIAWQAWSIALLIMLLINPLSVLTTSFWLSFCSVALIIYGISGRLNPHGLWWKLGRMQWVIALGLIPLSIWLFQQCSIVSFIANSIAIPTVGFIIVPLTLLGSFLLCFSAKLGSLVLLLADKILGVLWVVLAYLSHLSWASWYQMIPSTGLLLLACMGIVIVLLPSGLTGRLFGFVLLLPLFFYHYPTPKSGDVWFTLLDVGQGLSAVVQTQKHVLVFDAGPRLSANYDMGESVVAPFLRSIGKRKVDMLVVSHPDNDHIGGSAALFHYFNIATVRTSTPDKMLPFPSQYCLQGESWQWDGVKFTFLYPSADTLNLDNDSSCVLQITSAKQHRILLTGDIEKFAERSLVEKYGANLATDILVAPHHGSKTSAINEFVQNTKPRYVLFAVGYRNRYHFPNTIVEEKYRNISSQLFATDVSGAIKFTLDDNGLPVEYRVKERKYWNAG